MPRTKTIKPITREEAARRYKAARLAAGYATSAEVARILDVNAQVACRLETGKRVPTWSVLLDHAATLGFDPRILFAELFPANGQPVCETPMGTPARIDRAECGRRVRAARLAAGWETLAGAARAAGIDEAYFRDVERGRTVMLWPALLALAANLKLDPSILFPELFASDRVGTEGHPRPVAPPPEPRPYVPTGNARGRPRTRPQPDPLAPKPRMGRPPKAKAPAIGTSGDRDETPAG